MHVDLRHNHADTGKNEWATPGNTTTRVSSSLERSNYEVGIRRAYHFSDRKQLKLNWIFVPGMQLSERIGAGHQSLTVGDIHGKHV